MNMTIKKLLAKHGLYLQKISRCHYSATKQIGKDRIFVEMHSGKSNKVVAISVWGSEDWYEYFKKEAKVIAEDIRSMFKDYRCMTTLF